MTFFILFLLISLLGEILSTYRLYLIFGLVFGFCFSWFIRDRYSQVIRFFITASVFGVFVWIIYSVLNSSFFYKDVIMIFIKGVFILEFIFSFNAYEPQLLSYIQALSIPLFMSAPIFIESNYNEVSLSLTLAYFIIWVAIFKVKFYGFLNPPPQRNTKRYYLIFISGVFFLIILISSWIIFIKFPLGESRVGGIFQEEGWGKESLAEEQYYGLQDKIQKEIERLIPKFDPQARYEIIYLLSFLIKESPYPLEIDRSEVGLIDYFKRSGPGLQKTDAQDLISFLRGYVDKKIVVNLKRTKESAIGIFRKNPFDVLNRMQTLSRVNKMQYSDTYKKVSKYEQEIKKYINSSSLSARVKSEMKELTVKLKEWKTFDIYRKKMAHIGKSVDSLKEELKEKFPDLLSEVRQLEESPDYKNMNERLRDLKETMPSELKNLTKEIEDASDLRLEVSLARKNIDLKYKFKVENLIENKIVELEEGIDSITDAQDYSDLERAAAELRERTKEEDSDTLEELKEFLEMKVSSLLKAARDKIEETLKQSLVPDTQRKELLKSVEELQSAKDAEKLLSDTKKLMDNADKLQKQGLIFEETRDSLLKQVSQLKDILLAQLNAKEEASSKEEARPSDTQAAWEVLLEKTSIKEETKDKLARLTQELSRADTTLKIESIKQAAEKEFNSLSNEGKQKEAQRLSDAFEALLEIKRMHAIDKSLFNLSRNIEKLKKIEPHKGRIIEEDLRKIRNSPTEQEFQKRLDVLKEDIDTKGRETKEMFQGERNLASWQIYIMPLSLIMPIDSLVSLKSIAVYNKVFLREPGFELEWFSTDPAVASVNKEGIVHSLSKGSAKISARYRGKNFEGTEVIVVDRINEGISNEIKSFLMR